MVKLVELIKPEELEVLKEKVGKLQREVFSLLHDRLEPIADGEGLSVFEDRIVLREVGRDQFGEEIELRRLEIYPDRVEGYEVVCMSSSLLGLGTCQCHSHNPTEVWTGELDEYVVGEIVRYVERKKNMLRERLKWFERLKEALR